MLPQTIQSNSSNIVVRTTFITSFHINRVFCNYACKGLQSSAQKVIRYFK